MLSHAASSVSEKKSTNLWAEGDDDDDADMCYNGFGRKGEGPDCVLRLETSELGPLGKTKRRF